MRRTLPGDLIEQQALIISEGGRSGRNRFGMDLGPVERILTRSVAETACPINNSFSNEDVGCPAENAFGKGDEDFDWFYEAGTVNAEEVVD